MNEYTIDFESVSIEAENILEARKYAIQLIAHGDVGLDQVFRSDGEEEDPCEVCREINDDLPPCAKIDGHSVCAQTGDAEPL